MKKWGWILAVLLLTACSVPTTVKEPSAVQTGSSESSEESAPKEESVKEESAEEEASEQEVSESESEAEEPAEEPAEESAEEESKPALPAGKAEIEETVLLEESGIRITAKSLDMDDIFGPQVKLLIENESDANVTVQCSSASVNGYMVDTMMSVDVVSGKKANDALTFLDSDFEKCGITTIADMEFVFRIFDSSSWETILDSEPISLKTTAAEGFTYTFDESGQVAYESDEVTIRVIGLIEDPIWGPAIRVSIENKGTRNLTVQTRDVSINGFMVDPMFSSDVNAGKHAIDDITFMESDLEKNDITEIESVELSFHFFDWETWDNDVDTEVVSITF